VEDHFDSLAQLVAVWRHRWFKADEEDHWREKHLIDSTTAVSFGDLKEAHEPPHGRRAWRLTEEVKKNLDKIRESLKVFGDTFLNASQLAELRSIYVSFRACFFRQGLLGTARDLLPFFWQLGEALSLVDQWREYLEPPKEDGTENRHESLRRWAEFSNGLQKLFGHLQRAVRNRIEHRSLQGDPPIPHTLTHGAGNIINSFSAVFWLAAELFRRHPEQTGDSVPGDIRCFAAAVCAGSCGRVECDELFDDFRRFIENERPASGSAAPETSESRTRKPPTIPRPRRLLSLAGLPWSQRLLLLDISGVSLLRPELCFVHGLHEMAELSEWIMLPRNERLRTILNQWVVDEVAWAFAKALAQSTESPDSETCEPDVMAKARALHEFVLAWVMYSGVAHGLGHSTVATSAGVWEKRGELFSGPHPADLPGGLQDALEDAAEEYRRALEVDAPLCKTIETVVHDLMVQARGEGEAVHLPDERANVLDAARSDEFALTVEMIESLAKEVVADIGMWAAADHVLGEGRPRTSQDRLRDLNRIYKSLLRATAESYTSDGTRPRVDLFVLHRWAIQIAALSDGPEWIEIIHSELQNLQAELEAEWAEEQRESVLAECSQSTAPLHTLFPDEAMRYLETNPKRWPVQFGSQSSLTASLRTLACYRTSATDDAGIPRFAPEKSFSPMERELFSAFRAAWNHPDSQHHSTRPNDESIRFVQLLWATAGCFGVPSILEEVPPKEEQSPSTQPP